MVPRRRTPKKDGRGKGKTRKKTLGRREITSTDGGKGGNLRADRRRKKGK